MNFEIGVVDLKKGGCSVIAVYNLLLLAELIRQKERYTLFGARLGINPFGVLKLLREEGFRCACSFRKKPLEADAEQMSFTILLYLRRGRVPGAHYALLRPAEGFVRLFQFYNDFYGSPEDIAALPPF